MNASAMSVQSLLLTI